MPSQEILSTNMFDNNVDPSVNLALTYKASIIKVARMHDFCFKFILLVNTNQSYYFIFFNQL